VGFDAVYELVMDGADALAAWVPPLGQTLDLALVASRYRAGFLSKKPLSPRLTTQSSLSIFEA